MAIPQTSHKSWSCFRLEDLAETCSGTTPSRGRSEFYGGRIPWVKTGELLDGSIFDSEEHVSEVALRETSLRLLPKGTLLVAMYGQGQTRGRTGLLECEATINQACFAILPNDRFVPEFLQFWFRFSYERLRHATENRGGNQPNLNGDVLRKENVPVPPLSEQIRIVERLREQFQEVERARAAVNEQLEAADGLPTAFLRAAFCSSAAKQWARRRFSSICKILAKQVDPRLPAFRDLPHVSGENIVSGNCKLENVRTAAEDGMKSGKYLFEPGDVLYSKLRPYLRKAAFATFRGLCSADMYPIRVDAAVLDARFATWLLVSEPFTTYAVHKSERSRMPKLNREQLFAWGAPLPPLHEQKRIAEKLEAEFVAAEKCRMLLQDRQTALEGASSALLREVFGAKT